MKQSAHNSKSHESTHSCIDTHKAQRKRERRHSQGSKKTGKYINTYVVVFSCVIMTLLSPSLLLLPRANFKDASCVTIHTNTCTNSLVHAHTCARVCMHAYTRCCYPAVIFQNKLKLPTLPILPTTTIMHSM